MKTEWCQGAGIIDLKAAHKVKKAPSGVAPYTWSSGNGSLEAARGSFHLYDEGVELNGEYDIFGQPFDSAAHASDARWEQEWTKKRVERRFLVRGLLEWRLVVGCFLEWRLLVFEIVV